MGTLETNADRALGPQGRAPSRSAATSPPLTLSLPQQFRMLMASTSACYKLFREKQKEGHGEAIMFKGECPRGPGRERGLNPQRDPGEDGVMTGLYSKGNGGDFTWGCPPVPEHPALWASGRLQAAPVVGSILDRELPAAP